LNNFTIGILKWTDITWIFIKHTYWTEVLYDFVILIESRM